MLLVSGQFYTPWSWLPRIVMQFTAGALVAAAVIRLQPSDRGRRAAGYVSALLIAGLVGLLYLFDAHPLHGVTDTSGLVDVLFVPLVMTLAIGAGSLPALLSTRVMVFGGQVSFCLYMVHELVHTSWIWAAEQFHLTLQGNERQVDCRRPARDHLRHGDLCCITSSRSPLADGCAAWSTSAVRRPTLRPIQRHM